MNNQILESFRGKSVFVTGHTGFKGSWLCLWLEQLGARVTGYALEPPTEPNNFTICSVDDSLENHWQADIRDLGTLRAAIGRAEPDVVLHLAAQSVVRMGYDLPRETFDVNVMGTVNVLEAIRSLDKPCVVVCVTSDKCYQNREQVWGYRESDPMGERDPYGGSKGAAELAIRSYRDSFFPPARYSQHGIKLASGRAGNVIGGGDWTPDALIVDVVHALTSGQAVRLRRPLAYRPWQHVLQALSGYLTLAAKMIQSDDPSLCDGWNFGPVPGNDLAVYQLVESFFEHWGDGRWIDESSADQPHESNILRLSIDKALWQLDWRPTWNMQQTLAHTAEWYRRYLDDPSQVRDFSIGQIHEFCDDWDKARFSCSYRRQTVET